MQLFESSSARYSPHSCPHQLESEPWEYGSSLMEFQFCCYLVAHFKSACREKHRFVGYFCARKDRVLSRYVSITWLLFPMETLILKFFTFKGNSVLNILLIHNAMCDLACMTATKNTTTLLGFGIWFKMCQVLEGCFFQMPLLGNPQFIIRILYSHSKILLQHWTKKKLIQTHSNQDAR